jgi:hypothetical protein
MLYPDPELHSYQMALPLCSMLPLLAIVMPGVAVDAVKPASHWY